MSQSAQVREKFNRFAVKLNQAFVEREGQIEVLCNALVADEHVLLIGQPGEAKSAMLDALVKWMNCKRFSCLLNGQSTLGDIFGPISLSSLKKDRHERNTDGKLPEAEAAFIDEPMRGNSAVRNAMLRIMNERQYDRGDGSFGKVPLRIMVAASNDWPRIEDEAEAFFDRFTFRMEVKHVASSRGLADLLFNGDHVPDVDENLDLEELELARKEARELKWSNEAKEALMNIIDALSKDGIVPSSRRLVKAKKCAQASAWLDGAEEVDTEHLAVLAHVLWTDPAKEYRAKAEATVLKFANPSAARVQARMQEMEQIVSALKPNDLVSAQQATAKLSEIAKKLKTEKSAKAKAALDKVNAEVHRIKVQAVQSATSS